MENKSGYNKMDQREGEYYVILYIKVYIICTYNVFFSLLHTVEWVDKCIFKFPW